MLDALPATTIPMSRLWDWHRICLLAYPETDIHVPTSLITITAAVTLQQ